jgi:hypothetical protein
MCIRRVRAEACAWPVSSSHLGMLPDEQPTPEQIAIYRRMTPGRRLALAEQLYWSAREIKAAWLRAQHAEWDEEQVAREVTRVFSNART